jgi:hypothetical protein
VQRISIWRSIAQEGAAKLSKVQHSFARSSLSMRGQGSSEGWRVAQKGATQLSKVQQSSGGYSVVQKGAACRVAHKGA